MNNTYLILGIVIITLLLFLVLIFFFFYCVLTKRNYSKLLEKIELLKFYNTMTKSTCQIPYPIFYINMDRDQNRKEYMENQLTKISKNYQRIRGVNGYLINNTEGDTVEGLSFINAYPDMTKAEIGCTLSHFLALQAGYDSNSDIVMICEDDVVFDTCTIAPPLTEIVKNAPDDWDILQLVCIQNTLPDIYSKLNNFPNIEYIKRKSPDNVFWSTACYLVHRRGLEKIIDIIRKGDLFSISPIREVNHKPYPSQGQADTYILDLCNTYSVLPCPFLTNNTSLTSTIHDDHTPFHLQNSLVLLSKFKQLSSAKQLHFAKTLLDMDLILNKNNQRYFLACGTALGAVREGQFIEHDGDIDIGIFYDEFNPEIEKEILKKFSLKHRLGTIDDGYELTFIHPETNVSIDIFLHYRQDNFIWYATYFNLCNKAKNKKCRWRYTPFTLKPFKFLSNTFNIPYPTEKYLTDSYGPEWRTPKKYSYVEGLNGEYRNLIYDDFGKQGQVPDKFIVWQYWETKNGSVMPEYIRFCMDITEKACKAEGIGYIRLSPDNIYDYIDTLPENWSKLSKIAHKADYVRALVLYKYGGLWLDADSLVQSSLLPIMNDLQTSDWVVFIDEKDEFHIGIFAVRKNSPLLKMWIDKMTEKLRDKSDFFWTELGYDILYPLWRNYRKENKGIWRAKLYNDRDTCFPIFWNEWETFFSEQPCDFVYRPFQPVISLYNAMFPESFKKMSSREFNDFIRLSPTVLADLFRRSKYN